MLCMEFLLFEAAFAGGELMVSGGGAGGTSFAVTALWILWQ